MAGLMISPMNRGSHLKEPLMKLRLLRHATLVVEVAGKRILVDPMLSKKGAMDPVANAGNDNRIPMVELPVGAAELDKLLKTTDAVLITHIHRDHWDAAAQEMIGKNTMLFCQPADAEKIRGEGFTHVQSIEDRTEWNGITIHRTNGQHGTGEIGKKMGIVSGYVLIYKKQRLYIAGDTIWCSDVQDALTKHQPTHIILNGGGAQFLEGGAITMTIHDVLQVPVFTTSTIDIVHLETVNHCLQRRADFRAAIKDTDLSKQIRVPNDGDWVSIS